jgi:threonine dehydrogenase-like Zn-dependent dehydrogenase
MKNNPRREFLKSTGLAGLGLIGASTALASSFEQLPFAAQRGTTRIQSFNMCGFRAPKLERVRVGVVGLGMRGPGAVDRLSKIEGVEIVALCDLLPERVEKAKKSLEGTKHKPEGYSGNVYAWKKMCERQDLDLVYIATPWDWHVPMAVYAMESGKHAAV